MLPFTQREFFALFGAYNTAIWPAIVMAYALGAAVVVLMFRPGPRVNDAIVGALAAMWAWTGVAYHWLWFSTINSAAFGFGVAFASQGAILVWHGWVRRSLSFQASRDVKGAAGFSLIVYAAVLYPVVGLWLGHAFPYTPMFGVSPCPVTIFTLGCLLLTNSSVPWPILVIPVIWSFIGGSAAVLLDVRQDWVLLGSGVLTVGLRFLGPAGSSRRAPTVSS
jgi:hypothetical protein